MREEPAESAGQGRGEERDEKFGHSRQ
jgi:hypothetical protein